MTTHEEATKRPALASLFGTFLLIGLTAFGGGASAHIHDAIVSRKKWIDEKQFLEGMTMARIIPGTSVSNLAAFVGSFLCGYRGACVAVAAVTVPGVFAVLALAAGYARFAGRSHTMESALHGLTAGAVGVMSSLVLRGIEPARQSRAGLTLALAAFVSVGIFEVNLLAVLVALLPVSLILDRERGSQ